MNFTKLHPSAFFLLLLTCFNGVVDGADNRDADYAFLYLMTLSPDIAAANYVVSSDTDEDVDISILRVPFHVDLMQDTDSRLQLEIALALQQTEHIISTFSSSDEFIDSRWQTYGGGLGLLYEHNINQRLKFTPSVRLGLARMENEADFNGVLTNKVKDFFDEDLNWKTNASVFMLGLGLSYNWKLLDRASSVKADVYHAVVDTFEKTDSAIDFTEHANMLAVKADMVFPTDIVMHDERLDLVLLLGANNFFGENRNTLGYTTSYQAGVGAEIPLKWGGEAHGYLRLSGQIIRASNMKGWMLGLGYSGI